MRPSDPSFDPAILIIPAVTLCDTSTDVFDSAAPTHFEEKQQLILKLKIVALVCGCKSKIDEEASVSRLVTHVRCSFRLVNLLWMNFVWDGILNKSIH